ncbi:CRISPR-associated protein Cas5, partial [Escherichia coli]|nr:CRISPR-associated protein Cas5 [Escherichia coli]
MNDNLVRIRVWGDFACFTRPEMKVERVSYPIMTPSAARGVLEAIFWKPEMYYIIDSITAIRRGKWTAFKRNELKD